MVSSETFLRNVRLSSVGPALVTGTDVAHEFTGMDLAMKLHYIKGLYLFSSRAAQGLTSLRIKEAMFWWLNEVYVTCGRLRRHESGWPFIKCNDCGVRYVEAVMDKTVDEWLEMAAPDHSLHNHLIYHGVLGPELSFSPSLYLQLTKFKCGGIALGLSWAHILGDPFSASDVINRWGQVLADLDHTGRPNATNSPTNIQKFVNSTRTPSNDCLCAKRVDPVGDLWITANNCKMDTYSFSLNARQLSKIRAEVSGDGRENQCPLFESICAVLWRCIARVREGFEPQTVTVCKEDPQKKETSTICNSQIVSSVHADFSVAEAELKKLAVLLAEEGVDERTQIEEAVEKENGASDFIVYGGNLTFANWESLPVYELEIDGQKPVFAYYAMQGVGDEGSVFVMAGQGGKERLVTVTLPENQVVKLKSELKKSGLLVENSLE